MPLLAQDSTIPLIFVPGVWCEWHLLLRPVDWEQLKVKAKEWLALFPGVVGAPTREERLLSAQARAWFAVIHKPHKKEALDLGAQPCQLCGLVTHSWCESCFERPLEGAIQEALRARDAGRNRADGSRAAGHHDGPAGGRR